MDKEHALQKLGIGLLAAFGFGLIAYSAVAQVQPFQRKFGTTGMERLWRVGTEAGGTFIGVGHIEGQGQGERDMLFTRFDANGTILDSWALGTATLDQFEDFVLLDDGSMVVVGRTLPFTGSTTRNGLIARIDANGNPMWTRFLGDQDDDVDLRGITRTSDGRLVITGVWNPSSSNDQGLILNLDQNASLLFAKSFDLSSDFDGFDRVIEVDGGYVASGVTDVIDPSGTGGSLLLAKFSTTGTLLWSNYYNSGSQVLWNNQPLLADEAGTLYVAFAEGSSTSMSAEFRDIVVMRLDPNGSPEWSFRYNGVDLDDVDHLIWTPNGHLMVTGDLRDLGAGGGDGLALSLVKDDGHIMMAHAYGGQEDDELAEMTPVWENGCVAFIGVGGTRSHNLDGSWDGLLIKTDEQGGAFGSFFTANLPLSRTPVSYQSSSGGTTANWNLINAGSLVRTPLVFTSTAINAAPVIAPACVVGVEELDAAAIEAWPNPTHGPLQVRASTGTRIISLALFDLQGRTIPTNAAPLPGDGGYDLDLGQLPAGIYILSMTTDRGLPLTHRVIVEH